MASITWTIQNPKSAIPNQEGLGGRSTTDKYVTDDVRQGFTGYLNDEETGLDYAQARMYKKELGRFTGADHLLNSGRPGSPDTWNRYCFVRNNPVKFVDPSGFFEWDGTLRDDGSLSKDETAKLAKKREKILAAYDKAMAAIKAARDAGKLTGDRLKRLNDAMTALGPKPGEKGSDNGVTIGIGDVEGGVGQTLPEFTYNQADQSKDNYVAVAISVTFTEDFVKSDGLFAGLVHEGSHVFDQMEYANHPGTFFNSDNPFNLTKYQTETNAFQANSYLFEAMDVDGSKYDIPVWNKTWTQVDKNNPQVTADDRRASAIKEFVSSQYKVSGDMQGADFKSYGYKAKRIK